jgi:hypothetical protein
MIKLLMHGDAAGAGPKCSQIFSAFFAGPPPARLMAKARLFGRTETSTASQPLRIMNIRSQPLLRVLGLWRRMGVWHIFAAAATAF